MLAIVLMSLLLLVVLFMTFKVLELNTKLGFFEKQSDEISKMRDELYKSSRDLREELTRSLVSSKEGDQQHLKNFSDNLNNFGQNFNLQLRSFSEGSRQDLNQMRELIEARLKSIQDDNSQKLELMRVTVDEKLSATLEKRLDMSFKQVSERLEQVHKGLGEMQSLATGVGDLRKVLTNVKTRGTWGEMQLANLLEQVLSPDQYEANVATKPNTQERVDFAIKLPGDGISVVWLPIDAKFPQEDYQRLLEAQEQANVELADKASKLLEQRIKDEAKSIRTKYIEAPYTTDFALLYLPTEGLYAEVLRRPGLMEKLQVEFRVNIVGPTTLAALLNSLQMGFRTLTIQKRSSEVWKQLAEIKKHFGVFGDLLLKAHEKVEQAGKVIEDAGKRSRTIETKLRKLEELPGEEGAEKIIALLENN
jgi:DNA recombination protein RmuC